MYDSDNFLNIMITKHATMELIINKRVEEQNI